MLKSKKKFAAIGAADPVITGSGSRRVRSETFHAVECARPEVKMQLSGIRRTRFRARRSG